MEFIKDRVLLSLGNECEFGCKHCYTFELPNQEMRSIDEIVSSVSGEKFDVAYISQRTENFVNPEIGLKLCESVFDEYKCHIMIISRQVLNDLYINRLVLLYKKVQDAGKMLFFSSSVVGMESASVTENLSRIPSTKERLDFLKTLSSFQIPTILLIRPLFPNGIIPLGELHRIIDYVSAFVSCVVTGPLMVDDMILERLSLKQGDFKYMDGGESEYLSGALAGEMKFVNVMDELNDLHEYCNSKNVHLFSHSMPALNYIVSQKMSE